MSNTPIIYAHRGCWYESDLPNNLNNIQKLLQKSHERLKIEIDVWYDPSLHQWRIGHDYEPSQPFNILDIASHAGKFLLHCKNIPAFEHAHQLRHQLGLQFDYFMHDADPIGITNNGLVICNYNVLFPHPWAVFHPNKTMNQKEKQQFLIAQQPYGILTNEAGEWYRHVHGV